MVLHCSGEVTSGVTSIPGNPPGERPRIDYQHALPFPLPSANPREQEDHSRGEPQSQAPGGASPGGRGSGEKHFEFLHTPDKP
jgi:hypothetical protein